MKQIKLQINGIVPIIMHNNRSANPLSPVAKYMKPLQAKRKKTDEDYAEISRCEWESGLYMYHGEVVLPAQNVEKCFIYGARKSKQGKLFESGVFIEETYIALDYAGPKIKLNDWKIFPNPELDVFYEHFNTQDLVKVGMQTILRTRPIFEDWSCSFTVTYDETVLDERTLIGCAEVAGRLVGLCERRPRMGRFDVQKV